MVLIHSSLILIISVLFRILRLEYVNNFSKNIKYITGANKYIYDFFRTPIDTFCFELSN